MAEQPAFMRPVRVTFDPLPPIPAPALMMGDHLIHGESAYPVSMTLVTALLLLALGLVAAVSIVFDVSLLG